VTTIMLEVPTRLKPMIPAIEKMLKDVDARCARSADGRTFDSAAFEENVREDTAAIELGAMAVALAALDVDSRHVMIGGVLHSRVGRHETTFHTQVGDAPVTRSLYRKAGERNGRVVDPVALRSGCVAGEWLPGAARQMAFLLQQGTAREAEQTAKQLGRLPYSRCSFDRVGHAVGARYLEQHESIEQALIEQFELPDGARGVSVSVDRISVPIEEPRPRPVGRPHHNAPRRPCTRAWRMAYCGTVTIHDAHGEALHTIRYGTMPKGNERALVESMASDVLALLEQNSNLKISLLCDGAPEMWNLLDTEFDRESFGRRTIHRRVDFWHLIEKLAAAAEVLHGKDAAHHRKRWAIRLLNSETAALAILGELRRGGREYVRVGDACPVHDAITYLENHGDKMNYANARALGLPIGSGQVEATCKSLFALRFKRPGSRWKQDTGEHVVHLRALALSDRWDHAMDITLRAPRLRIREAA
jgi:hypothetical protein